MFVQNRLLHSVPLLLKPLDSLLSRSESVLYSLNIQTEFLDDLVLVKLFLLHILHLIKAQ